MTTDPTRPLAGIRVVELSTMVTASLSSMIFAQQGAEVVKVEPKAGGDPMRYLGTGKGGISALFHNCNRGKRSLGVDLKTAGGRDAVAALIARADVVMHNYRPGVMDRLGLGSEASRAANPKLIYMAITGFGLNGPLADAPAYDHVVQGLAGFTAQQGRGDSFDFVRTLICDKTTAYTVAQSVTAALFARERGDGTGQHIDMSMLHACLAYLWPDGMMNQTLLDEDVAALPPMAEYYQTVQAEDGSISFAALQPEQWAGLFRTMGRDDMASDPRLADIPQIFAHIDQLCDEVRATKVPRPCADILAELTLLGIPCTPCLSHDEIPAHPQVAANGIILIEDHPAMGKVRTLRHPAQFSGLPGPQIGPSPALGEHTHEILAELGYNTAQITALAEIGAV